MQHLQQPQDKTTGYKKNATKLFLKLLGNSA